MPNTLVPLGERVRELRGRRLSQGELAERSDLAPAALSRLLTGERAPRMEHLVAIAAALNVTLAELTVGTDAASCVAEWVPRADYEDAEAKRIETEELLTAQVARLSASEAENRALRSELARLNSLVGGLQQGLAEARASIVGERAAREAASHAAVDATGRAQRAEWALDQTQKRMLALRADVERSGVALVATGLVAAALGAAVAASESDDGPRRRKR